MISGTNRDSLLKYEIKIQTDEGQWIKLTCLAVTHIGWKPHIEEVRFKRLCNAFNVSTKLVDNGQCAGLPPSI